MKITELLKNKKPIFSCEFFPPKTDEGMEQLFETVRELKSLNPGYVSVTYGAGGSTRGKTIGIVKRIKKELGIEAMAHLTCVGHSKAELREILDEFKDSGIKNVIALRGDPPKGSGEFQPHPDGFKHAVELVRFIKENYDFCVAVAGYPEGHVEALNKEADWDRLAEKVKAGGDMIVSQLFFDNRAFFAFQDKMKEKGVSVPIITGIMPITNASQIVRFTQMCGAKIPPKVQEELTFLGEDPDAVQNYGARVAAEQCKELLEHGVPGIHFYTLNKSKSTRAVIESLKKYSKIFAAFLLLSFAGTLAWAGAPDGVIFGAMEREMARSKDRLKFEKFSAPYFLSYEVLDTRETTMAARYGTLTQDQTTRSRYAQVRVRYGNYEADSGADEDRGYSDAVTIEDSPDDIRHRLWLLTDAAYKQAIKDYLQKQGKKISEADKEKLDDFSIEKKVLYSSEPIPGDDGVKGYAETLKSATLALKKYPEVQDGGITLRVSHKKRYLINTEGSKILSPGAGNPFFIYLWITGQAEDGMNLNLTRTFSIDTKERLPSKEVLSATLDEMAGTLLSLKKAKVSNPFTGPALLDPESTGVLFHEAIGHRLEGERQRNEEEGQTFKGQIGKGIVPPHLTVTDDPTAASAEGISLNGHYAVDDEGVRAQKVTLIENGVLKNFLLSRRPVSGFNKSNGHGRAQFGRDPIGRMSNLFVKSSKSAAEADLKKMLLEECVRQGKPFGMIVKRTRSGDTFTGRGRYQAFRGTPEEVIIVDAKTGTETRVRGLEVVGTPLITINKIIATGTENKVLNAFCGAESGTVPVSTIAPWSLVQEIELQRVREDKQRPPILPPPPFEEK